MGKSSMIKTSIAVTGTVTIFTLTLIFGFQFLKGRFGIPEDVLEQARQVTMEIKQKQNSQLQMEYAAKIPGSVIKLWMNYGENGRLEAFVLEVFQIQEQRVLLLTIPGTTRVTMSNELYQEMQAEEPFLPQLLTYQSISDYFPAGKAERFAARLTEELLDLRLDSYAAVTQEWMDWFLTPEKTGTEEVYQLSEFMQERILEPITVRRIKEQIEQLYADPDCLFSKGIETVMPYLEAYEALGIADITSELLPGEHTNAAYLPAVIEAKQRIYEYQKSGKEER